MLVLRVLVLLLLMLLLMPVRFRTAPRTVSAPSVFLTPTAPRPEVSVHGGARCALASRGRRAWWLCAHTAA